LFFTSGGTEADNLAILGIVEGAAQAPVNRTARKHVVTSTIEHHAVLNTCQELEKRGVDVTYVPVSSKGVIDPGDVRRALRPETVLITVMHANNELGTLQPIEEIGQIAKEAGVRFHCDAVQSAGKVALDVNRLGVDLLSISATRFMDRRARVRYTSARLPSIRCFTVVTPNAIGGGNRECSGHRGHG